MFKSAVLICLTVFALLSIVSCEILSNFIPFEDSTTPQTETTAESTPEVTTPEETTPEETTPEETTPEVTTPEETTPEETTPEVTTPDITTPDDDPSDDPIIPAAGAQGERGGAAVGQGRQQPKKPVIHHLPETAMPSNSTSGAP